MSVGYSRYPPTFPHLFVELGIFADCNSQLPVGAVGEWNPEPHRLGISRSPEGSQRRNGWGCPDEILQAPDVYIQRGGGLESGRQLPTVR